MKIFEKIGISVAIIITPILFYILHYQDRDIEIWILTTSILSPFFIPFGYDMLIQHKKRKKVTKFIEEGLKDIEDMKERVKDKKSVKETQRIKKILRRDVEKFYNIMPYIQNAYNEDKYTIYNSRIEYLRDYKINAELENYYNIVLVEITEVKKMLSFP